MVKIENLRLWNSNPRYTNYENVSFKEIGKSDFNIKIVDGIQICEDLYEIKIQDTYKKLINNKREIDKMIDLLESLSMGFNPDIDEILAVRCCSIEKIDPKKYIETFYVLEGNRRIFAIMCLLNLKGARNFFQNIVKEKKATSLREVHNLFEQFDQKNNPYVIESLKEIEVKVFDLSKGEDEIWRALNSRHFGNRKGKMNWPRGLVLEAIYKKVKKIREEDFHLMEGERITSENFKYLKTKLEDFTGKKISESLDITAALFVTDAINKYNEIVSLENKIKFNNTSEEGQESEEIRESETNQSPSDFFSISALELSKDVIKFPISGEMISLKKYINLNIDINEWKIKHDCNDETYTKLVCFLIKLIKERKLTTRSIKSPAYTNEILSILTDSSITLDEVANKDINKFSYENLSYKEIADLSLKDLEKKIIFSADPTTKEYEKMNIKIIKENFIPIFDSIYGLSVIDLENNIIKNKNWNPFENSLIHIWMIELQSFIRNKEFNKVDEIQYFILSSSLRSTVYLFDNWISYKIKKQTMTNSKLQNYLANSGSASNLSDYKFVKNFHGHLISEKCGDIGAHFDKLLHSIEEGKYKYNECDGADTYISCIYMELKCQTASKRKEKIKEIINNDLCQLFNSKNIVPNFSKHINNLTTLIYEIGVQRGNWHKAMTNLLIHKPNHINYIESNLQEKEKFSQTIKEHSVNVLDFIKEIIF